jgi:hypothetical protein
MKDVKREKSSNLPVKLSFIYISGSTIFATVKTIKKESI